MPLAGTQSIPAISKPQFGTKSLADHSCDLIRGSLRQYRTIASSAFVGYFSPNALAALCGLALRKGQNSYDSNRTWRSERRLFADAQALCRHAGGRAPARAAAVLLLHEPLQAAQMADADARLDRPRHAAHAAAADPVLRSGRTAGHEPVGARRIGAVPRLGHRVHPELCLLFLGNFPRGHRGRASRRQRRCSA